MRTRVRGLHRRGCCSESPRAPLSCCSVQAMQRATSRKRREAARTPISSRAMTISSGPCTLSSNSPMASSATCNMQHATCSMQPAACNMQHRNIATCSIQRATLQPVACSTQHVLPVTACDGMPSALDTVHGHAPTHSTNVHARAHTRAHASTKRPHLRCSKWWCCMLHRCMPCTKHEWPIAACGTERCTFSAVDGSADVEREAVAAIQSVSCAAPPKPLHCAGCICVRACARCLADDT